MLLQGVAAFRMSTGGGDGGSVDWVGSHVESLSLVLELLFNWRSCVSGVVVSS